MTFLSPEAQVQRTAELLGAGAMVVDLVSPLASVRGRLAEHLDDSVERELGIRGAPSPYLNAWSAMPDDAETRMADQLFRARTVGATGIAIAMGSLSRIATPALTPEDSAALRTLARAASSAPLVVLIDDGDSAMGAYAGPVTLQQMLRGAVHADVKLNAEADDDQVGEPEPEMLELVETRVDARVAEVGAVAVVTAAAEVIENGIGKTSEDSVGAGELPGAAAPLGPVAPIEKKRADDRRETARRAATAGVAVAGPGDYWRSWAIALSGARGPQPLGEFERLFTESYMPLTNAIAAGLDDPRALRAHDEFRSGFERSYTDAFVTFGASGRRPRLVMDAFDVAAKQARLHNARNTHLLVVNAMRQDLGCLVRDELAEHAGGVASLTSESLLWSALPTTTYRQLETLARGIDALRAPTAEEATESLRGRSAESVRRMRVGSRELYKLDMIPSMLGDLGFDPSVGSDPAELAAALEDIATSVTDAILRHIETLTTRTLLLVIGDHGFTVDRRGRISHGGATPEEVLVPCLAYVVGALH